MCVSPISSCKLCPLLRYITLGIVRNLFHPIIRVNKDWPCFESYPKLMEILHGHLGYPLSMVLTPCLLQVYDVFVSSFFPHVFLSVSTLNLSSLALHRGIPFMDDAIYTPYTLHGLKWVVVVHRIFVCVHRCMCVP